MVFLWQQFRSSILNSFIVTAWSGLAVATHVTVAFNTLSRVHDTENTSHCIFSAVFIELRWADDIETTAHWVLRFSINYDEVTIRNPQRIGFFSSEGEIMERVTYPLTWLNCCHIQFIVNGRLAKTDYIGRWMDGLVGWLGSWLISLQWFIFRMLRGWGSEGRLGDTDNRKQARHTARGNRETQPCRARRLPASKDLRRRIPQGRRGLGRL